MPWTPSATVTIDGTNFTSSTLFAVQVSYGRTSIWQQPRAGYANIQLLNANNTDYGIEPNQAVTITMQDSTNTTRTIFTGKVSAITNKVQNSGDSATVAIQTITATSVFSRMARVTVGTTSYPLETDSDRITRIYNEAGVTIESVDIPTYEFDARAASSADAYTLAATYATQAFGYIYETTDGRVGFANEGHRTAEVLANGYTSIPTDLVKWQGISSQKTDTDVTNYVTVEYKTGSQTESEPNSILEYGFRDANFKTELHKKSDATDQARRWIALRSLPRTSLSAFVLNLDDPRITNALLDKLIQINLSLPIEILGLPIPIKNTVYEGFVEGWTFNITRLQASLTIQSSDAAYSLSPTRWSEVNAALQWNGVGAAVQWYNYDN